MVFGRLSIWSWVTLLLAVPLWWVVLRSAVMDRKLDGGVFLSVAGGLNQGLQLYTEIWDNKDPIFFVVLAALDRLAPIAPFLADWLWLALASWGTWMLAASIMRVERALFLSLLASPLILTGVTYVAGYTHTPGTALALLAIGLFARGWSVAAGMTLGLLVFTKILLAPFAIAALCLPLIARSTRTRGIRSSVAWIATVGIGILALAVISSPVGYWDMIQRNRRYATDVMLFFELGDGVGGHFDKLRGEMPWGMMAASVVIIITVTIATDRVLTRRWNDKAHVLMTGWLWAASLTAVGAISFTYIWDHHLQVLALPAVITAVVLGALWPSNLPQWAWLGFMSGLSLILSGWLTPGAWLDRVEQINLDYGVKIAEVSEIPATALLLNQLSEDSSTYAVVGTNDERGFMRDVRPGLQLGCPQFHLYRFSPPADFDRMRACIQTVDSLVVSNIITEYATGGREESVNQLLATIDEQFTCTTVEDRRLCTRS